MFLKGIEIKIQGSKLTDAKTLNAHLFFSYCIWKLTLERKKCAHGYFSKCSTRIVPCYFCSFPKCLFSVFNIRINFKMQAIYILCCWDYNSTGLSVSLVFKRHTGRYFNKKKCFPIQNLNFDLKTIKIYFIHDILLSLCRQTSDLSMV